MNFHFAAQLANLKPSAIREILKSAGDPNLISLAAGNPAPEAFPSEILGKIAAEVFASDPTSVLQYSVTEGYAPLRKKISDLLRCRWQIQSRAEEVLVTSGAQQAIELTARALCNPGDVILCEDPSFIGSLNAFRSHGVRLVGVPMEEDGVSLAALEEILKREKSVKLFYTIPNFQNPTGRTTSLAKRKRLLELAMAYDFIILEDDPYGELRFAGEKLPPIKSFDPSGYVVYCGSFSKTVAPGLRLGFAIAHKELLARMTVAKQGEDVHTALLSQVMLDRFLQQVDYDSHIHRLQEIYRAKADVMLFGIRKEFSSRIRYTVPEGGLFIWATLPDEVDMPTFCKKAAENLVAVVPGKAFCVDEQGLSHAFRMNFSTPTNEQIEKAVQILGRLTKEVCGA